MPEVEDRIRVRYRHTNRSTGANLWLWPTNKIVNVEPLGAASKLLHPGEVFTADVQEGIDLLRDFPDLFDQDFEDAERLAKIHAEQAATGFVDTTETSHHQAILDELQSLSGVGLKTAERLYGAGFRSAMEVLAAENRQKVLETLPVGTASVLFRSE